MWAMPDASPAEATHLRTPGPAGRVLVLGASGRLGGICRSAWTGAPGVIWQLRRADTFRAASGEPCVWSPLHEPAPRLRLPPLDAVLCLAGVVRGPEPLLAGNSALARAAVAAGRALGARAVLVASSGAVYGPAPGAAAETTPPAPVSAYGRAKLDMERAVQRIPSASDAAGPRVTCLRIGNVAGCDALLGGSVAERAALPPEARAPVVLDRFGDGRGPVRSYIGPWTLARVLAQLVDRAATGAALPPVLNLAQPGAVSMSSLLDAAGIPRVWRPAPGGAVQTVALDVSRLMALEGVTVQPSEAVGIVAEWQRWRR